MCNCCSLLTSANVNQYCWNIFVGLVLSCDGGYKLGAQVCGGFTVLHEGGCLTGDGDMEQQYRQSCEEGHNHCLKGAFVS